MEGTPAGQKLPLWSRGQSTLVCTPNLQVVPLVTAALLLNALQCSAFNRLQHFWSEIRPPSHDVCFSVGRM